MAQQPIRVFYKWTAHPGKLDELRSIYQDVLDGMEQNEPDADAAHCFISEEENALYVLDVFKHGGALGLHLGGTAAAHFPQLIQIAVPGPFFFCGEVPDELRQATEHMGLAGEFSVHAFGFDR
jgi:hypothetical protein